MHNVIASCVMLYTMRVHVVMLSLYAQRLQRFPSAFKLLWIAGKLRKKWLIRYCPWEQPSTWMAPLLDTLVLWRFLPTPQNWWVMTVHCLWHYVVGVFVLISYFYYCQEDKLTIIAWINIALGSTLGSAGAAPVPNAGVVMLITVWETALPGFSVPDAIAYVQVGQRVQKLE